MVGNIPRGWRLTTLGDLVCLVRNGTTASQISEGTPFPVTRIETIADGIINRSRVGYLKQPDDKYLLKHGDILYSHINSLAHIGKIAFFDQEDVLYHGMNLMLIRGSSDLVFAKFLFSVLASEYGRAHARRECKPAINQVSLAQTQILALPIMLPPLPEQRRIAAILDAADEAIRAGERVIAKLRQVKAGALHDLLTCGVDAQGRLRDPRAHPEQFKDSPLGRIPREWEVRPLESLVDPSSFITYGVVKPGPEDEHGVLFIRGGDFPNGEVLVDQLRTIAEQVSSQYQRTILEGGELLISLVGQPGACAVVPPNLAGANIARQAAMIRLQATVRARFIRGFITSEVGHRMLMSDTLGSVQQVINLRDLRNLLVPLPPQVEQDRIIAILDAHDARLRAEETAVAKLRQVKAGLMEDLLTGRVRV